MPSAIIKSSLNCLGYIFIANSMGEFDALGSESCSVVWSDA